MRTEWQQHTPTKQHPSTGLRDDVLAAFSCSADAVAAALARHGDSVWRKNFKWLDSSGLALYLVDRLGSLGCKDVLPPSILARFNQNLADNRARTDALFREAVEISHRLQAEDVRFAISKGITLFPESVRDPALRCQLDLDFLIRADHVEAARVVMERSGYRLRADTGATLEYRAGAATAASISDYYKPKPQRCVDLHRVDTSDQRLGRVHFRSFWGEVLPALSPADLFIGQAMHLFSHLSGAFTRAAWALEYRNHLLMRSGHAAFWAEVEERATERPGAAIGLGISTLLVSEVFNAPVPPALAAWTTDCLSPSLRLWVQLYGRHALSADFPGSKLYLLLQKELLAGRPQQRRQRRLHLLPLHHVPPMITDKPSGERLMPRLRRYSAQARFILFRLRFHVVENLRYAREASRWDRRSAGASR